MELSRRRSDREDDSNELNITLDGAVGKNAELKERSPPSRRHGNCLSTPKFLKVCHATLACTAAGVVIADRDLSDYIPLCHDVKGNDVISQYGHGTAQRFGTPEEDFLGLKTLTVIEDTLTADPQTRSKLFAKRYSADDAAAFALYNRGETIGLFQMESGGMTSLSKQLDVKKLDDIIALIALYRPGPMELIPEYVKAKKGDHADKIFASAARGHLRRHLGVMIYRNK